MWALVVAVPWARLLPANTAEELLDVVTVGSGMCWRDGNAKKVRKSEIISCFGVEDQAHDLGMGRGPVLELVGVSEGVEVGVEVGLVVGADDVGDAVVVVHGLDGDVLWLFVEELCERGEGGRGHPLRSGVALVRVKD